MSPHPRHSRAAGAFIAACVLLAVGLAAPLNAAVMRLPGGKALSYVPVRSPFAPEITPLDDAFTNLDYSGGPVMPSNTNYTIYWSPGGLADFPAASGGHQSYPDGVDQFFIDIAADSTLPQTNGGAGRQNVESVATQYNDASGNVAAYDSHFGGRIVDTAAYPTSGCAGATICLTGAQMEAEIARVVHANALPADLTHQYFLITPPGVESCFDDAGSVCSAGSAVNPAYCAYHGNIGTQAPIIYSIDNYVSDNPGCVDADPSHQPNGLSDGLIQGGMSHEHNEAITDPMPNSAWTDFGGASTGGENGDKCNQDNVRQDINGRTYWYQSEWSNFTGQCLARLPLAPTPVSASFTAVRTSPITADFTATSDAGAGAMYVWQFNDWQGPGTPQNYTIETDSPRITHEFPAPGPYTVALTVMRADGMSRGAARDIILGTPPTASFAPPTQAIEGDDVTFNATASSTPNAPLTGYRWTWGDGSPDDTAAAPTHRFAAPGTYRVRLEVTDSIGLTDAVSHDVVVVARPATTPPVASPPALALRASHVSRTRRSVRVAARVHTDAAGALRLRATTGARGHGHGACTARSEAVAPGDYTLSCTLGARARQALRHGRLTMRIVTTFTGADGATRSMSRLIILPRRA